MKIAVCVKLVPGPDAPSSYGDQPWRLERSHGLVLDDADTYSIEVALRLAGDPDADQVTVVSVGPSDDLKGLRTALAMGAHRAVLACDPALQGTDALGTAKVLNAIIRGLDVDLVLAATESTDGYTGTVPVQLAELLGYPSVTFATSVELDSQTLSVKRQTEFGHDIIACPMPAVVTVTAGAVEVRYPSFKGIMSAKSKPIDTLSLSDLSIDSSTVGATGAGQEVVAVEPGVGRGKGTIVVDDGSGHETILATLESWKLL